MELRPEEIVQTKENPLELFYSSIKSEYTKQDYDRKLRKVMCEFLGPILNGDPELVKQQELQPNPTKRGIKRDFFDADYEIRVNEFVKRASKDPEWVESILVSLAKKFGARTRLDKTNQNFIKAISLKNYFNPIQKLLEMNNVTISWKRIRAAMPKSDEKDDTREYTNEEIQKMLLHCKIEDRVLVLLAASSGIRAGAFNLKWKHFVPIYEYENRYLWEENDITESVSRNGKIMCAMIRIYAGSQEEYFAFITPECWKSIQGYRELWIKETSKEPKEDDPFFRKKGTHHIPLSDMGIRKRLERVLEEAGIRKPLPKDKRRHKVPAFNGFRRFYNKASKKSISKNSALASLILKENMMGHSGLIKLDKNYFKSNIAELVEEYLQAIPFLTISDEQRAKDELVNQMRKQKDQKSFKDQIDIVKQELEELKYGPTGRRNKYNQSRLDAPDTPEMQLYTIGIPLLLELVLPEEKKRSMMKEFEKAELENRKPNLYKIFGNREMAEEQIQFLKKFLNEKSKRTNPSESTNYVRPRLRIENFELIFADYN